MKKLILISLSLLAVACTKVPAGYVGVKVHTMGGAKGIDHEVVGVGYYFLAPSVEIYKFPVFMQNYIWTKSPYEGNQHHQQDDESFTFQTKEGLSVNADIGISYEIDPAMVSKLFQTYREGIEEITNTFLRNIVRDALNQVASQMVVEDIYGSKKSDFIKNAQGIVADRIGAVGIRVDHLYLTGEMRLPQSVVDSLNAKIAATQDAMRVENEVAKAKFEAEKKIAEARGEAESNRLKQSSLSEQYLKYLAIQKWNGAYPQVTGGSVPMISIGGLGK